MTSSLEVRSKQAFLAQVVRLLSGRGEPHVFCYSHLLRVDKDPLELDAKIVSVFREQHDYDLLQPAWKRSKRFRGCVPSIRYLRYDRFYALLATHGRMGQQPHQRHPLFVEYPKQVQDLREKSMRFLGYQIRLGTSNVDQKPRVFIRLDEQTRKNLEEELLRLAVHPRYGDRQQMEGAFWLRAARYPPYRMIHKQMKAMFQKVNRKRGQRRLSKLRQEMCVPWKLKTSLVGVDGDAHDIANAV